MNVSVRELKSHLSEYLRRTQAGEEITVASHGRPVGRLVPPRDAPQTPDEDALARLRALPGLRNGNGLKVRGGQQGVLVPPGTVKDAVNWVRGE